MTCDNHPPQQLPDQVTRDAAKTCLDTHFLLDAGAGSGKTRTLVGRYLYILDNDEFADVDNIVAITFTRKAAREMKERIRRQLVARMATADRDDLRRLRERVRKLETAPICTIHSFCAGLLQQYPFAANLDPRFTLLDETQTAVHLPRVVEDSLLAGLAANRDSTAVVVSRLGGLSGARDLLLELLNRRSQYYRRLREPPSAEDVLREWERVESDAPKSMWKDFLEDPKDQDLWSTIVDAAAIAAGLADEDKLAPHVLAVDEVLRHCSPATLDELRDAVTKLKKTSAAGRSGSAKNWGGEDALEAVRKAVGYVREAAKARFKFLDETVADPGRETAELAASIWAEASEALKAWRSFEETIPALDFEDVQIRLLDLLRSNDDVCRAIRERFRHILVDEFQDTDWLQRELLWWLAGLEEDDERGGCLFLVGDAKQSIYRFRNADVRVFTKTSDDFQGKVGATRGRLSATFRAHGGIVEFLNRLFSKHDLMGAAPRRGFEVAYEPMVALRPPRGKGPWVFGMIALARVDERAALARVAEAELIASVVRQLLDDRPLVYDHDLASSGSGAGAADCYRPLRAGDIAILFRAATDVSVYEDELAKLGIPYYNAAGRGFYTRPEVTDLLNLARAVANPNDAVALVGVLRSPLFALSDATLFWLSRAPGTWWERVMDAPRGIKEGREPYCQIAVEERGRLGLAAELLAEWRGVCRRVPVSSLLEWAVEKTGYSAAMAALPSGERCVANIHKLLDYARDFDRAGGGDLMAFAEELALLAQEDAKEEQAPTEEELGDSVRLSTVHGAKGLQWPVVIVADLNRQERVSGPVSGVLMHPDCGLIPAEVSRQPENMWRLAGHWVKYLNDQEEAAENKRLLYVALTRASEILILSSGLTAEKNGAPRLKNTWLKRLLDACGVTLPADVFQLSSNEAMPLSGELCPWFVVPREGKLHVWWLRGERSDQTQEPPRGHTVPEPVALSAALARVAPDASARKRFTVTELARYLQCPRYYWLRYVEGLPDTLAQGPSLRPGISALEMGNLAHHLLRMVGTSGVSVLHELLRPVLPGGRQLTWLDDSTQEDLRTLLGWYLEHDFYKETIVGARLRTEAPVSFVLDDVLIEGKVDAVAEKNGSLVVIDYKTGTPPETEGAALEDEGSVDADRFQVALYSYGLYKVTGRWPREGVIVYLRQPGSFLRVPLPQEGLQAARRAAQAVAEIRAQLTSVPPPKDTQECRGCALAWACERAQVTPTKEG